MGYPLDSTDFVFDGRDSTDGFDGFGFDGFGFDGFGFDGFGFDGSRFNGFGYLSDRSQDNKHL